MHGERNYPIRKIASDLDIGLPDGTDDEAYLATLRQALPVVTKRAAPDLVFYNAGVDPHFEDRLGRMKLSDEGLRERDRTVIGDFRDRNIPSAASLAAAIEERRGPRGTPRDPLRGGGRIHLMPISGGDS